MQSLKEVDQVEMRTTVNAAEDGTKVAANNVGGLGDSGEVPSRNSSPRTAAPAFNEQTNYVPKKKIITIFLACSSVDFIALMDQTTLAASVLIIGNQLDAGIQSAWISGGYFVTSTSFQLLYGRLSDIWSRKFVLLTGLLIFFFGSLAASLSQNALQLILFRAVTGIGGGGLMTVAQTIVSDVVPLRERGKYQGILGAVVALANGIGPVVGGALASQSVESWRWIFRLNLPLSVITGFCVIFFMPLKRVEGNWRRKLKAIDFVGTFLALSGSTVLVLGLIWAGGEYPWGSSHVISALAVGGVTSIGFVCWQWKGAAIPLMPIHMFKHRLVNGACLTMFINGWNFLVQVYYIPSFYQLVYGYSAARAGALLLPITLVQTLSSTFSGLIVHWHGRYRESILIGWVAWAVGLGLFSTLDESSGLGKQIGYAVLAGFGVGQTLQPSLIAIQAGVDRRDMAVVTATRNFVRNLGGILGLAISGTIINNTVRSALISFGLDSEDIRSLLNHPQHALTSMVDNAQAERIGAVLVPAYRRGFRIIFIVSAVLAALAAVLVLFLMPQVELNRPDDKKLKEEGINADEKV